MSVSPAPDEILLQFLYRAPFGLVQSALDGTIELMNPAATALLMPLAPSGALDNVFDALIGLMPELRDQVDGFTGSIGTIVDAVRRTVSGLPDRTRVYEISAIQLDAARLMVTIDDVSDDVRRERELADRRLHDAARLDPLTNMPNEVAIADLLADAALAAPDEGHQDGVALLLIGCDRLSRIAETLGNALKDQVLACMAQRLRTALRSGERMDARDDVVARAHGDEFLVILHRVAGGAVVPLVAQRLLDALAKPYVVGPHQFHVSVSIGIVPLATGAAPDALLRDASVALAEAKRAGGSRWAVFEAAMRERALLRVNVERDLRRALERSELFVVYQPVLALGGAHDRVRVAGVEALVRWRHPERGIVPPIDFIGVAEEAGLIHALGAFVLRTACARFMGWSSAFGPEAPGILAVNLSRAQLAEPHFVDDVRETLAVCGMPAERLQLEVTESLAAQDDDVRARLHALKDLGVRIALDDFGTGFSSLSSLHLLPVDTVKIDRSFVGLLESSPHHRVLIEATVLVARSLGMSTVAEGIETAGQADLVRGLGCDKGQGYWYSRPLDDEALRAWLVDLASTQSLTVLPT